RHTRFSRDWRSDVCSSDLFVDSGGVRLHEANAGLIAISEIMRAMLQVRNAGIPIITVIGGTCGAFGGMGISACLSSTIIMTEERSGERRVGKDGSASHVDH